MARGERVIAPLLLLLAAAVGGRAAAAPSPPRAPPPQSPPPLRATLPNGLRVVIVRNALAPVVTVEMNFLVGGEETPRGFPGMAHAQEHMAFRGCAGMSADQTAAVYAQLGGENNADTQQTITQYFATVPSADLAVALEAQAACLRDIEDSQREWAQERGAIEQEVARDLSNPTYKFIDRAEPGHVRGNSLRPRLPGYEELLRRHHRRDAQGLLQEMVRAGQCDPGHRRRRGSARHDGRRRAGVRRHPEPPGAEAAGRQPAAGQDRKASRSTAIFPTFSDSSLIAFPARLPGLRRGAGPGRRVGQPARRSLRDGARGQGARRGVRAGGDLSEGERRLRTRGAACRRRCRRARFRRCAGFSCATRRMASRRIWSTRPSAARLPRPSFSATPFPGLANVWSNALAAEGRTSPG